MKGFTNSLGGGSGVVRFGDTLPISSGGTNATTTTNAKESLDICDTGMNFAVRNGTGSEQCFGIYSYIKNVENTSRYGHRVGLYASNTGIFLTDANAPGTGWTLSCPVLISQGGTGATTAAKAKENLGLGLETLNFRVAKGAGGNTHVLGLYFNCVNELSSLNGHAMVLIITNSGIQLYDETEKQYVWNINGTQS